LESRLIKDVVIYWSPFEEDFNNQLQRYSGGLRTDLIGWSFEEIRDEFNKFKINQELERG
jgi:hypothetical protein